jgi:hypothetical protein
MTIAIGATTRDHRDNRDRRHDRSDVYSGKNPREDDHEVNVVKKPSGCRDYQDDYNKALKVPCQLHSKSNHTMENCRFLKNIYAKQLATDDTAGAEDDAQQQDGDNDDDEHERDPHHQYVAPTKTIHSIFSRKVSLDSKRERKLLKRACMSVTNADGLITNPRFPAWSHQKISFNQEDWWAVIPKPG